MLNFKKMFEPFTGDGCTFDLCIAWVKEKTKAGDNLLELGAAKTMLKVSQGRKFENPCKCGCGGKLENIHTPISHDMLIEVAKLQNEKEVIFSEFIERNQKQLFENQQRQLSTFDKEYNKLLNGTLWQKVKKAVGLPYHHWGNE